MVDIGGFVFGSPDEDSDFTPVNENEALALVGHIGAQSAPNDTMPGGQVHLIELCLDDLSDVVKDSTLLEGESNTVNGMLLHALVHIGILYHCIFGLLLIHIAVGLDYLCVRLSLPLLRLRCASVGCNLGDCLGLHFLYSILTIISNLINFLTTMGFWGFGVLGFRV